MTLTQEYESLRGEIVDTDIYHMRDVEDIVSINDPTFVHVKGHKRPFGFVPDVVIDLGANVGLFSGYVRSLFPNAYVVAVEPDLENCKQFLSINQRHENLLLINKAIGSGQVYKSNTSKNGAGENYITVGVAYPEKELKQESNVYELSEVKTITLSELIDLYVEEGQKFIVKMDIEGNEQAILSDDKEIYALCKADYVTAELHHFSINQETNNKIKRYVHLFLKILQETHNVEMNGLNLYAVKK